RYWLDGEEVGKMDSDQLAEVRNRRIGFVFQSFNLLSRVSAVENVELPLRYNRNYSSKQRRELALEALDAVGLANRRTHTPAQLSCGQQLRVAIARALVGRPALLLADEATGNLDSRTSLEILALFQKLESEGKTIVFVTHSPDVALYSARTLHLLDGRLRDDETVAERKFV
ncbi:MAG: ATP-binding cassette domain-containing protein, partial [Fibrobacterales bacterium]|nr:ATP-binding cassette domain-containing protein [Fibrobacterales bacterium]